MSLRHQQLLDSEVSYPSNSKAKHSGYETDAGNNAKGRPLTDTAASSCRLEVVHHALAVSAPQALLWWTRPEGCFLSQSQRRIH